MRNAGSPSHARLGDAAGTLRLLAYLAAALALAVLDHRGGWMHRLREQASVVAEPVRAIAGLPNTLAQRTVQNVGTVSQLGTRNRELRRELLLAQARIARMSAVIEDNARLRALLDAAQRNGLDVQLAPILGVDLDPTRQRIVLDAGARDGVREGQSVIDAYGLVGQVTRVGPLQSDVLLITDPDHAVPVAIARNGVRLMAYGSGRSDLLSLASIPLSSDVKVGDAVVTSGLGGRFPAGFPVGRIIALRPDESRAFLRGDVRPSAQLDRGREVLLLRSLQARAPIAPAASGIPSAAASGSGVPATGTPQAGLASPASRPSVLPAPATSRAKPAFSPSTPAAAPTPATSPRIPAVASPAVARPTVAKPAQPQPLTGPGAPR